MDRSVDRTVLNSSFIIGGGGRVGSCVTSWWGGEGGRTVVMFHDLVAVQKAKPFVKLLYDGDFSHYADFIFASLPPPPPEHPLRAHSH